MASSADHAAALVRGHGRRCALNHVMCEESAVLTEGAELAFFPPITGG
jgi:molybdopterin synthase sulfur carrier subunit